MNRTDAVFRPMMADDALRFSRAFAEIGWSKPPATFAEYVDEQSRQERWTRVAVVGEEVAGYVTLVWHSPDPVLRAAGIPEIMDLNVLPSFRRQGLGSRLVALAEDEAATRGPTVGLRMGLHGGYGAAQRIYVRRGYLPDGRGVVVEGVSVEEGASLVLDDGPALRLTKRLDDPTGAGATS